MDHRSLDSFEQGVEQEVEQEAGEADATGGPPLSAPGHGGSGLRRVDQKTAQTHWLSGRRKRTGPVQSRQV